MTRADLSPEIPAQYFPNVVLRTHDNKRVRFYDDLIRDKIVLINFFYTTCAVVCELATKMFSELVWKVNEVEAVSSRFFANSLLYD